MNILTLSGRQLDELVAEYVMGEKKPTYQHAPDHLYEIDSLNGNWYCLPEYDDGDKCHWHPKPFSTHFQYTSRILKVLEKKVATFNSTDGSFTLSCGHFMGSDNCIRGVDLDEWECSLPLDPRPWYFHIHLGLIGEEAKNIYPLCPPHWDHGDTYCVRAETPELAICRAAVLAFKV